MSYYQPHIPTYNIFQGYCNNIEGKCKKCKRKLYCLTHNVKPVKWSKKVWTKSLEVSKIIGEPVDPRKPYPNILDTIMRAKEEIEDWDE